MECADCSTELIEAAWAEAARRWTDARCPARCDCRWSLSAAGDSPAPGREWDREAAEGAAGLG